MNVLITILLSLVMGSYLYPALPASGKSLEIEGADVTEQVNKTVTLSPGANVRVSGINGRVIIETWESDKAEIKIAIKASDREAMERRPLIIEDTPNSLTIRTEESKEGRRGDRGWVKHDVNLRLPRSINLKINGVNGRVDVGQITGEIGINGINGSVDVALAGTATNINGINGHTKVMLMRLGEGGLRVNGINGGVEIGLPGTTNANVDVRGVNGGIDTDLPITVLGEVKRGELVGTMGSGGSRITISGINGGVTLRRT